MKSPANVFRQVTFKSAEPAVLPGPGEGCEGTSRFGLRVGTRGAPRAVGQGQHSPGWSQGDTGDMGTITAGKPSRWESTYPGALYGVIPRATETFTQFVTASPRNKS